LNTQYEVHNTSGIRDAGRIGKLILQTGRNAKVTVVIAGGDGTAHELIEGVLDGARAKNVDIGRWEFVVLPLGTVGHEIFASGNY
jgi:diacylglycerol kinase family enzyme